jgi:Tol biopolymer transport system component
MQSDGTDQKRQTTDGAYNGFPAWSPDGQRITFRSSRDRNQEVYLMNADGSAQTNLTRDPGEDNDSTWSPDGTRIAFRTNRNGHNDIYSMMNADGSRPTLLTNSPAEEVDTDWGFPRSSPQRCRATFGVVPGSEPTADRRQVKNVEESQRVNVLEEHRKAPSHGSCFAPHWFSPTVVCPQTSSSSTHVAFSVCTACRPGVDSGRPRHQRQPPGGNYSIRTIV